jgi:hypothetical protein
MMASRRLGDFRVAAKGICQLHLPRTAALGLDVATSRAQAVVIVAGSPLAELVTKLNQMEWSTRDLSPHFGAWCRGRVGMKFGLSIELLR